jgi:hypothetical protein
MAATEYEADWVINSDADEFWWPETGDLKSTLQSVPETATVVVAARNNFLPVEAEDGPFFERMTIREVTSLNPVGDAPLPPKWCHRATPDVVVEQGNHKVAGMPVRRSPTRPVEILHFPMRSYSQFENKIRLGGNAYARNTELPVDVGRTWRALFDLFLNGELRERYEQDVLRPERLRDGLVRGELMEDTRLRDFLASAQG